LFSLPIDTVLVQGNIPQEFKWESSWSAETLNRYFSLSREHRDADFIVWPESAIPMFIHQAEPIIEQLTKERVRYQTDFLVGIPIYAFETKEAFNSALSLSETPGIYDKRHLVPFGEYLPFRPVLQFMLDFLSIPMSDFTPGDTEQDLLRAAGQPIGMAICYEIAYPAEVRRSLPEATILVNISNDAWFGDSIGPRQHLQIARMRALESGRYVLRAANTGISAIIDERGKITERIEQFELAALRTKVQPFEGATPYVRIGDWPIIALMFGLLLAAYFFMRRAVQSASKPSSNS
ncbi:MAG: apolipoprotein N-acyltransferase, partial [Pseudomonadota bacterium]